MENIEHVFGEENSPNGVGSESGLDLHEASPLFDFGNDTELSEAPRSDVSVYVTPRDRLTSGSDKFPAKSVDLGKNWRVTIIESGVSDNQNWYRPSILKDAIPLFEGAPIRIYQYDGRTNPQTGKKNDHEHNDHMPAWVAAKDSGVITGNTVGALRNVSLKTVVSLRSGGKKVPALVGDCVIIDPSVQARLLKAWKSGFMDTRNRALFELSIEAEGPHIKSFQDGKQIKQVQGINSVKEVTIVSKGAAGGRFLSMSESLNESKKSESSEKQDIEQVFDELILTEASSKIKSSNKPDSPGNSDNIEKESPPEKSKDDKDKSLEKEAKDIDDDDQSQGQRAISLLRAGNLDLGIELLEDIFVKHEDLKKVVDQNRNSDVQTGHGITGIGSDRHKKGSMESLKSKKLKKESVQYDDDDDRSCESDSNNEMETEPITMKTQNQEPQNDSGSESQGGYQIDPSYISALHESVQNNQEELLNFARFTAERDNEREQRMAEALEELEALKESYAMQQNGSMLSECQRILAYNLRESNLPVQTQSLIADEFDGVVFQESDLHNRIEQHRKHLYRVTEGLIHPSQIQNGSVGRASGMTIAGDARISMGRNGIDWVRAEFDRAFGYKPEMDRNLRESDADTYRQLPNNASILRPLQMWHDDPNFNCISGYVGENALLREATSTSAGLSVVLQNSMTKALLQQFMMQPALWREIAESEPVSNYLTQQRIVLGGLGRLPKVVESGTGTTYLNLGIPSSDEMTYGISNYGGLIQVTRQAILNDNLQVIQQYPQQAAEAAIMSLNILVFGTLIGAYGNGSDGTVNSALSYDGLSMFHANHNNADTAELAYDSLVNALNRLSEQRKFGNVGYLASDITAGDAVFHVTTTEFADALKNEAGGTVLVGGYQAEVASVSGTTVTIVGTFPNSISSAVGTLRIEQLSNPIAFQRALLVIPTQLRHVAFQLLASTLQPDSTTNSASFLAPFYANKELLPLAVHSMYLKNKLKNWYIAADKPVRIGFLGGREEPQLLLQDNPLVNNVFSGDLLSWKCFHEYGATNKGHLMLQGSIVS